MSERVYIFGSNDDLCRTLAAQLEFEDRADIVVTGRRLTRETAKLATEPNQTVIVVLDGVDTPEEKEELSAVSATWVHEGELTRPIVLMTTRSDFYGMPEIHDLLPGQPLQVVCQPHEMDDLLNAVFPGRRSGAEEVLVSPRKSVSDQGNF